MTTTELKNKIIPTLQQDGHNVAEIISVCKWAIRLAEKEIETPPHELDYYNDISNLEK